MMTNSPSPLSSWWQKPTGRQLFGFLIVLLLGLALGLAYLAAGFLQPTWILLPPLIITALASALLGYWGVPLLRQFKASQIIQADGPQSHLKKAGTPTMGGIFFVPVAVAIALIWSKLAVDVVAVSLVTLGYMAIGWIDDWQILRRKTNEGLTPRQKLYLQIGIALIFCVWLWSTQTTALVPRLTDVQLPGVVLPLGIFFWGLAVFTLVAESNATNLTDGVDGLAAGTAAIAFLGLGVLVVSTSPELGIFCACLSGGCLGFIQHNRNPAQVFMGDTGSLALGGGLAAVGILSGNLWGLLLLSGIFLVESLSVIAQVGYYKLTKDADGKGKRLLKMAPLHHHLELSGWAETQIVGFFYGINALLALLAVWTA
jgi:phospho-N-acetylmuramoyl-pentapeptide-transferase